MKISTITLTDFRAFPGPEPATFKLDENNLLVYGDNGSGKSSLFHALRGFFSPAIAPSLMGLKNTFSHATLGNVGVKITFSTGFAASWGFQVAHQMRSALGIQSGPFLIETHPTSRQSSPDPGLLAATQFAACLDYRSLLATNYRHGDDSINLFELAVKGLLAGYVDLATSKTLGKLWQEVLDSKPVRNTHKATSRCNARCAAFNNAITQALGRLKADAADILGQLDAGGITLTGLPFTNVAYNFAKPSHLKAFNNQSIGLEVSYHSEPVTTPQNYLNEARLSALGLALYLGARLACVPQTSPHLKLLVLDDVLIGLDQSNRIPVLDLLENRFKDWQIVLLTHDRLWFETARVRANLNGKWNIVELYESKEADACFRPIAVTGKADVVEEYLDRADRHLAASDWRAAAVYARSAFEMWLKIQCARHDVPIRFSLEPRKLDSNIYLTALEVWAANKHAKPALAGVLNVLALYRDTVFNPGSHSYPTSMSGGELRAAVKAMRFVNQSTKFGLSAINIAEKLMNKAGATAEELALAAGYLRVAFIGRLRGMANGRNLALPFSMESHRIKPADLWAAMTAIGWPAKRAPWVSGINTNSAVLLDDWTWPILLTFTVAQLQSALQAVKLH